MRSDCAVIGHGDGRLGVGCSPGAVSGSKVCSNVERGGAMKSVIEACLVGSILIYGAGAQYSQKPALKQGISVEMPVASHAVEMRAADEQNATVVAITADGKVFV